LLLPPLLPAPGLHTDHRRQACPVGGLFEEIQVPADPNPALFPAAVILFPAHKPRLLGKQRREMGRHLLGQCPVVLLGAEKNELQPHRQ